MSSPSGAGKTSISKKILQKDNKISLSISCTTRPRRKGEVNKKDYIFLSEEDFQKKIKSGDFLEYASVFGNRYGTLRQTVSRFFNKKKDVLFDIDWQGYQQLKQSGMEVVGIFILPPNKKELIRRLKNRGRDTTEEMKKRMSLAQDEISHFPEYDYVVVNDDWSEGLSSSIRCGLSEVLKTNPDTEAVILVLCDQPFLTTNILDQMVNSYQGSGQPIVHCLYSEASGPPTLFHKSLFPYLMELKGSQGAKKVVDMFPDKVAYIDFPEGKFDIDTLEDYHQLIQTESDK